MVGDSLIGIISKTVAVPITPYLAHDILFIYDVVNGFRSPSYVYILYNKFCITCFLFLCQVLKNIS